VVCSVKPYDDHDHGQEEEVLTLLWACGWRASAIPSTEVFAKTSFTRCAFVAVAQKRVVGFIRVLSDGEVVSYVTELAVAENARRQGIGRALVDAVAAEFPKARIDLLSTMMAQPFYEEMGFVSKPGYRRWPA
jgi:ribosomal protein S18 acetylase RimI-like enzyme